MRKRIVAFAIVWFALAWGSVAIPLVIEHPAGRPVSGNVPLADLLNSGGRIYGIAGMGWSSFYFSGDTEDFNRFLQQYAKLGKPPRKLILRPGQGKVLKLGGGKEHLPYDWEVKVPIRAVSTGRQPSLELWLGGQVELSKVEVPANVVVKSSGEIEKLVAAHEAKRKQGEAVEHPAGPTPAPATEGEAEPEKQAVPESAGSVSLISEKPRYAKVALNEDGSKVLLLCYDESQGTGKGYDRLYADVNFDGKFESAEILKKQPHPALSRYGLFPPDWAGWAFSPVAFDVPFNTNGEGIPDPRTITFRYQRYRAVARYLGTMSRVSTQDSGEIREVFEISARVKLRRDAEVYEYFFEGTLQPSENLESAGVRSFDAKPTVTVSTLPDGRTKGNLGVAIKVETRSDRFQWKKQGEDPRAHVEIKDTDGGIVHKGDDLLNKFVFG